MPQDNPFGIDATSLAQMLQGAFAAMPTAPVAQRTAYPVAGGAPAQSQFIDLGAGGPAPGSERGHWLSSIGDMAQQAAPLVGSAMANSPNAQWKADQAAAKKQIEGQGLIFMPSASPDRQRQFSSLLPR